MEGTEERKPLISESDIAAAINLRALNSKLAAKTLMKVTGINQINQLYSNNENKKGLDFINGVFEQLEVNVQAFDRELRNIPKTGSFIVVANHPLGALDGMLMIKLLAERRPDLKIMANFLLQNIKPLSEYFIGVNPFENVADISSVSGIKQTLQHLNEGGCLGLFPAGEVSSYQTNCRKITDREWKESIIKLIKKAQVPVIPIYFSGNNSLFFQMVGFVHPMLRTARLPKELLQKKKNITVRIGSPISAEEQDKVEEILSYGRFLRTKVYALGSSLQVKKFFKNRLFTIKNKPQEIVAPADPEKVQEEINQLGEKHRILKQENYELYLCSPDEIPLIMNEIGRLREVTFRKVGEGTNLPIDLDEYDLYYHHLFLWDAEAKKIAGAYRIGKGNDILAKYGPSGFYTESLFRYKKGFEPTLFSSIELGRSWVAEEYQLKRAPLFLLWKGIMSFIQNNPEYRFVIGPVSISNHFSKISQALIVSFIRKYYFDEELSALVKPRKPFKTKIADPDISALLDMDIQDLKNLDKLVADIEPFQFSIPVLLKKYINQNAKILAFNVDPKFNSSLDGLMLLDLEDLPQESVNTFSV